MTGFIETGYQATGSQDFAEDLNLEDLNLEDLDLEDLDLGRTGFHGRARFATLTNAIAATFAAASLSLCLIVALTALSIKVISI